MDVLQQVFENLLLSIGDAAKVIRGWVPRDTDLSRPMITITAYDTLPNYAYINIWSNSVSLRDKISEQVLNILNSQIKQVSVKDVMTISFEEEGILQPGSWKSIKGTKPVFRKRILISY